MSLPFRDSVCIISSAVLTGGDEPEMTHKTSGIPPEGAPKDGGITFISPRRPSRADRAPVHLPAVRCSRKAEDLTSGSSLQVSGL